MELSGSLSAWSRRVFVAVGVAALVSAVSVVAAGSGTAAADRFEPRLIQEQPDGMMFADATPRFVYFQINTAQSKDFELVLTKVREVLGKSSNPQRQQQLQGMKFLKLNDSSQGKVTYIIQIDTVVTGITYDPFKILAEGLPHPDVQELYEAVSPSLGSGAISVGAYTVLGGSMN